LKAIFALMVVLLLGCAEARAIIMRHDVPEEKYRVDASVFPALVDLPREGHGVLVAPLWVVTVAREVAGREIHEVTINGVARPVAKVVIHPGYKETPKNLFAGDAVPLMTFERDVDDIAMIELKEEVTDVQPVVMYRGDAESKEVAEILGKGATGNGLIGEYPGSPRRGSLHRAYTRIESTDGRWLKLQFHTQREAEPLEGMPGNGDEGGPVLIRVHGTPVLVALMCREYAVGNLANYQFFHYDSESYNTRISYYGPWIDSVMTASDTDKVMQ
jgi:hypothetical protein